MVTVPEALRSNPLAGRRKFVRLILRQYAFPMRDNYFQTCKCTKVSLAKDLSLPPVT